MYLSESKRLVSSGLVFYKLTIDNKTSNSWFIVFVYVMYRQTGNMYKNVKRKIERGVAFPTCLSVNNTVCHFSPLASDTSELEEGDMVKM